MGPLEAFLRSIPEHDQQRKKLFSVPKEKRRNASSPTHSGALWRPPIAPPLSEMADMTLQPSTSSGKTKSIQIFFWNNKNSYRVQLDPITFEQT